MKRFLFCIIFFVSSLHCFSGWDLINPLWIGFWGALKAMSHQFMPVTQKDLRKNQQEMLDMLNNRAAQVQQAALSEIDILFDNCKKEIETTVEPKIKETYSALQKVHKDFYSIKEKCENNISKLQAHNSKTTITLLSKHFSHIKEEMQASVDQIDSISKQTTENHKKEIDSIKESLQELLIDTQTAKNSLLRALQQQKEIYDQSLGIFHKKTEEFAQNMNKDHETLLNLQNLVSEFKKNQKINIEQRLHRFENTLNMYYKLVANIQPIKPGVLSFKVGILDRGSNHI